jgi:tetratricopeptide (TPR) repeat protein
MQWESEHGTIYYTPSEKAKQKADYIRRPFERLALNSVLANLSYYSLPMPTLRPCIIRATPTPHSGHKRRDLSDAYSFLKIAEIYREAGQHDKALDWAEQEIKSFPRADSRLVEFLAAEYHRRSRHNDAMKLIWNQFVEWPFLKNYQELKAHALKKNPRANGSPGSGTEFEDYLSALGVEYKRKRNFIKLLDTIESL